jgi:hypothetical protein
MFSNARLLPGTFKENSMKSLSILSILAGVTILYGGILTLTDDMEAGVTMVVVGGLLAAIPLWSAFGCFRNPPATRTEPPESRKRKRKDHPRVVRREEEEERPTYHWSVQLTFGFIAI